MKFPLLLSLSVLCFAVGALVSSAPSGTRLRDQLSSAAPGHAEGATMSKAPPAGAVSPSDLDARFGQLASAFQETNLLKHHHALYAAVREMSASDLPEMIERAGKLHHQFRSPMLAALVERWLELDASAASAWVRNRPFQAELWMAWARHAPRDALAATVTRPPGPREREIFATAIKALAGDDPKAQAAVLATLSSSRYRDSALANSLHSWAANDALASFAFARNLPPDATRSLAVEVVLVEWARRDPFQAMAHCTGVLPDLQAWLHGSIALRSILAAGAKEDPGRTLQWANQLPEQHRMLALQRVVQTWAEQEPSAALSWCQANGIDASPEIIGAAMRGGAAETLKWIESLPLGDTWDQVTERALSTASALTSQPVSRTNAMTVAALVAQLPIDAQERVAYQLGRIIGSRGDIEGVQARTEQFADPRISAAAIEAAAEFRLRRKPGEEHAILELFPDVREQDAALRGMAAAWREDFPPKSVELALRIADEEVRREVLEEVAASWFAREPQQAQKWLEWNSAIPESWRTEWLRTHGLQP